MSVAGKAGALNHWSAGIAFLGILFSLAPAAAEIGAGISAVGIVYYASKRRRHPAWGLLPVLPVLGALTALVFLTALPPRPFPEENRPSSARWVRSPLLWAAALLLFSVLAWMNFNPSAVVYRTGTWKQSGADRFDSCRGRRIMMFSGAGGKIV